VKKIWNWIINLKNRIKGAFANKPKFTYFLTNIIHGALCGLACSFTVASLAVAFGAPGFIIGLVGIFCVSWLYGCQMNGEERGVKYFGPAIFTFMVLPWLAVVTGYSLPATLILGFGFFAFMDILIKLQAQMKNIIVRNFVRNLA
jgi:hypothetical protein